MNKKNQVKWAKSGLLEGLNEQESEKMARIMENSAQGILFKNGDVKANALASEEAKYTFPVIRRVVEMLFEKYGHEKFYIPTLPAFAVVDDQIPPNYKAYVVSDRLLPLIKSHLQESKEYAMCNLDAEVIAITEYSMEVFKSICKDIDNNNGKYALYTIFVGEDYSCVRYAVID